MKIRAVFAYLVVAAWVIAAHNASAGQEAVGLTRALLDTRFFGDVNGLQADLDIEKFVRGQKQFSGRFLDDKDADACARAARTRLLAENSKVAPDVAQLTAEALDSGALQVRVVPTNAWVIVQGTIAATNRIWLPAGTNLVEVSAAGYLGIATNIVIKPLETTPLSISLTKP